MKKLVSLIFFLGICLGLSAQEIDRFCNDNSCGNLEPNWELAGQSVVCEGSDFNISGSSSRPLNNISRYYWFIEDLETNTVLFDTSFVDTTLVTYNYTLSDSLACTYPSNKVTLQVRLITVSDTCADGQRSCRFATKPLTVFLKPRARFELDGVICVGEELDLVNASCHGETFIWDFGDGTSSEESSPSKIYDTPGIYTIQLTAINDCGSDVYIGQVEVVGVPEASFDESTLLDENGDGDFCLPKVLDLSNESNDFSETRWDIIPSSSGEWEFTDPQMTLDSQDIQIRFLEADEYTIRLTASNECPVDDVQEAIINIYEPPTVQMLDTLNYCDEAIISTEDLNFSINGDFTKVTWQFENASVDSLSGESFSDVRFTESGKVIAIIEGPCETVRDSLAIDFIEAEVLSLSPDTSICIAEESLQLSTNLRGGEWSGRGIDENGLIDLAAAGEGTFTYDYNFGEGTSCAQQGSVSVEILDPGSGINTGPQQSICEGPATTQLTGASPAGGIWEGPGIIDAANGIIDLSQIETDSVYTYQYCLQSSAVGDCPACRPKSFILHSQPEANFQIPDKLCVNQSFELENTSVNGQTYLWDLGDGAVSTAITPTHRYAQAGNFDIQLEVTSPFGCRDSRTQPIFVSTPPEASFSLDIKEGCAPFTVRTTNQSRGDSLSYLWRVGSQTYTTESLQDIVIDSITEATWLPVELEVSNFCSSVNQADSVLIHPYPQVNFGLSEDEGCSPLEVDLINTTVGEPDDFFWDLGNGETSRALEPINPVYTTEDTLVSTYNLQLIATNECGTDTLIKPVTVFPPNVEAFIELDTLRACAPLELQLNSVSTPGSNLSWTFLDPSGRESGSAMESPVLALDSPGRHTFILEAANCGTDRDTASIEVLPAPALAFDHRPFTCQGQEVRFNNQSEDISGSIWDFGDGNTSDVRSPLHRFDSAGIYQVTLTAFSRLNNCTSTVSSTIEVLDLPVASFDSDRRQGCGPLAVNFSNTSPNTNNLNFVWDFGDGSSRVFTQNARHTFREPGNYQVMLTAYNADSCFADTSLLNVFVFEQPRSAFELPDIPFCAGEEGLQLSNISEGAVSYFWQINDSLVNSRDLVLPVLEPGALDIQLVVQNNFQCADTSQRTIQINPAPIADFSADQTSGCEDLRVSFSQNSANAEQFIWDFGNGNTSTNTNPVHIFRESGVYTVQLTARGDNGCPGDTASIIVEVLARPIAEFDFTKTTECGIPTEVTFTNNSVNNLDNNWSFGDGTSSDETNPVYFYVDSGPKQVQLVTSSEDGCRDTSLQVVDVFEIPTASFQFSSEQVCEGDSLQLINTSTEAFEYFWQIEGQGTSTERALNMVYNEAGTYEVSLIATYNEVCKDTIRQAIRVFQAPLADFDYEADFDPNALGEVQFNNLSFQGERYLWEFDDGNISQEENPYHEYLVNRVLNVRLTAYNDNDGLFTCVDTITKPVDPEWEATFYAPNALAPDLENDGVRYFKPVGTGLKDYSIEVYSPWGTRVWQSTELNMGQPSGRWDGTYDGQALPQGAYTWVATMTYEDGNKQRKVGTVTILR